MDEDEEEEELGRSTSDKRAKKEKGKDKARTKGKAKEAEEADEDDEEEKGKVRRKEKGKAKAKPTEESSGEERRPKRVKQEPVDDTALRRGMFLSPVFLYCKLTSSSCTLTGRPFVRSDLLSMRPSRRFQRALCVTH